MTDTVEVVKEFYNGLGAGDVTRAVAVLSRDLEWTEAEGFPYYSGIWRGPQAVVDKLLTPLARDWTVFSVTPHEFIAADERVVSLGIYAGTFRITGRSMSAPFAHRWVVREGKIIRFNMCTDTVKVLEAIGVPRR